MSDPRVTILLNQLGLNTLLDSQSDASTLSIDEPVVSYIRTQRNALPTSQKGEISGNPLVLLSLPLSQTTPGLSPQMWCTFEKNRTLLGDLIDSIVIDLLRFKGISASNSGFILGILTPSELEMIIQTVLLCFPWFFEVCNHDGLRVTHPNAKAVIGILLNERYINRTESIVQIEVKAKRVINKHLLSTTNGLQNAIDNWLRLPSTWMVDIYLDQKNRFTANDLTSSPCTSRLIILNSGSLLFTKDLTAKVLSSTTWMLPPTLTQISGREIACGENYLNGVYGRISDKRRSEIMLTTLQRPEHQDSKGKVFSDDAAEFYRATAMDTNII